MLADHAGSINKTLKGILGMFYEIHFMEVLINNFHTLCGIHTYSRPSGHVKMLGLSQPVGTAVEVMTRVVSWERYQPLHLISTPSRWIYSQLCIHLEIICSPLHMTQDVAVTAREIGITNF